MKLDKKKWRQAIRHYRDWNDQKLIAQMNAPRKTPAEKWREYVTLFEFARKIHPTSSGGEQMQTMQEWSEYYARILKFEKKRKQHGKRA